MSVTLRNGKLGLPGDEQRNNIEFDALTLRKDGVMNLSRDIHPLTDFKRNTSDFLAQLKATGEPVVLTINGKAELVVQDAESYQRLMDFAQQAREMESLRIAIEEMKAGKGRPIDAMFAEMETRLAAAKAKNGR